MKRKNKKKTISWIKKCLQKYSPIVLHTWKSLASQMFSESRRPTCSAGRLRLRCMLSANLTRGKRTLEMINLIILQNFQPIPPRPTRLLAYLFSSFDFWSDDLPCNQSALNSSLLLSHPSTNQCRTSRTSFYPGLTFGLHEIPNTKPHNHIAFHVKEHLYRSLSWGLWS